MKAKILVISLIMSGFVFAQSISVKSDIVYTIGAENNPKLEYLFVRPQMICADSKGCIYVADSKSLDIRKFDENGRFIKRIGRSGDGPDIKRII